MICSDNVMQKYFVHSFLLIFGCLMLEILQVPPFLAAEICELGMVITMLADSFLAQFGLFCLDVC